MYYTKDGSAIKPRPWHEKAVKMALKGHGATKIAQKLLGRKSQESTVRDFLSKLDLTKSEPVMDRLKVLFWDIETSPALSAHWGLYDQTISKGATVRSAGMLSHAWAWNDGQVYSSVLTPKEAIKNDYERIVREAWSLLDNADVVVGQNCLEVSTPVLKSDLTWCPVGELKVGDELVAFDEGMSPFTPVRIKGKWQGEGTRQVKTATVTENKIIQKEAFEVLLSNGDKVVTTGDHFWLGRSSRDNNHRWYKTDELVSKGIRLFKYMSVWNKSELTFNHGWLSGFISGEGSLKFSHHGVPSAVQLCQRPTTVWRDCLEIMGEFDIRHSKPKVKANGLGRGDCEFIDTLGGKWKTLELVGSLGVSRMIERYDFNNFGSLIGQGLEEVTVVSVTPVGIKSIAVMGTSSSTYFGAGYAMHNCKSFDIKRMMSEFIKLDLPPPSPFKVYDTLRVAKRHFKFERNDLDSLCVTLNIPYRKVKHEGLSLWMKCIQGDQEALNQMQEYNVGDIPTLRAVFKKLLPWDNQGVNFALMGENLNGCPNCGEDSLESTGKFTYTNARKYDHYRCKHCGANARATRGEGGLTFTRITG